MRRLQFPDRFGSLHDARSFCAGFFRWYNTEHRHSGIGLLTPDVVHHGLAEQRVAARSDVLSAAFAAHPERFVAGAQRPPARPTAVWINPPKNALVEPIRAPQVDGEQNFAFTAPHSHAADSIHIQVSPQNDTRKLVETVDAQSNTTKIIALNTEDSALNSDDPLFHFH